MRCRGTHGRKVVRLRSSPRSGSDGPPMRWDQKRLGVADQDYGRPSPTVAPTSSPFRQPKPNRETQGEVPAAMMQPLAIPELQSLSAPELQRTAPFDRRWMAVVVLCVTLGLVAVAVADAGSRDGRTGTSVLFWLGLLLIFVPIAGRVLMQDTDRRERLMLVVLLGVALYLVKVLFSPNAFTFGDEFIHLRGTQDILRTHHLFELNPLLPTAAYYPGLAAVTAGLVDLTDLSPFASGLLIIGVARVLVSTCFFLVAERVTGSSRAAAGASLVYAANPLFLFWSADFSYENLALPLAAFVVWWLGRTRQRADLPALGAAIVVIVAVVVTHHVVGFALTALLGAWWLGERVAQRPTAARRIVGLMTLVAGTATLRWFFRVAQPVSSYLITNNLLVALRQTGSLLFGGASPRHLYSSGGLVSPAWETIAGFAATGMLLVVLLPALHLAWRRRDHPPMAIAIVVAVLFPLSLVPRLVPSGVAVSGRSAEYVFFGLGCVLGLLASDATRPRHRRFTRWTKPTALVGWRRTALAAVLVTLVFIGDVTIGTAFYQLLPESSHPQGYPWSVQPDVISASKWAREQLGINQRFGANKLDSLALATYGEQTTLPENSVWPIFFGPVMNRTVVNSIKAAKVRYLFVDWRMTKGIPATPGYYFSPEEPGAGEYEQAFPVAALQKFASAACTHLIYDSSNVQIFDVSRIEDGSCVPAATSAARNKSVAR
jgi:hypothetical protein